MFLTVMDVCNRHNSSWGFLVAFDDLFGGFATVVQNIQRLGQFQSVNRKGLAADKKQLRQTMCKAAAEVAAATRVWALQVKNLEVAEQANCPFSRLLAGRDTASAECCQNVHATVTAHLAALADHGVTAAKLTALQQQIDAYKASIHKPRAAIVSGKTITGQLAAEFEAAEAALRDGLDQLMPQFAASAPTFYADYQNARVIVDRAATHKQTEASQPATQPAASPQSPTAPTVETPAEPTAKAA